MAYSSTKRRRIKPLARPTSFDINTSFDIRHYQNIKYGNVISPSFPAVATDEAFHVKEGELLMKFKPGQGVTYRDHQMHAFSFANGLKPAKTDRDGGPDASLNASNANPDAAVRRAILGRLEYAGVAVTEFKPDADVYEQGFVATLGGLNTLFNNGDNTINAGSLLCVDLPKTSSGRKARALQTGVPNEKLQFVVTTLKAMRDAYGAMAHKYIIGTALSYARPGQPVDIVLHRCNVVISGGAADDSEDDLTSGRAARGGSGRGDALKPKKVKRSKKSAPTKTAADA